MNKAHYLVQFLPLLTRIGKTLDDLHGDLFVLSVMGTDEASNQSVNSR
jgi:hypothetical protein